MKVRKQQFPGTFLSFAAVISSYFDCTLLHPVPHIDIAHSEPQMQEGSTHQRLHGSRKELKKGFANVQTNYWGKDDQWTKVHLMTRWNRKRGEGVTIGKLNTRYISLKTSS